MANKKENRIFEKSIKEILFAEVNGEFLPRTYANYDKLPEEAKRKLRQIPDHLYATNYRGSFIQKIHIDLFEKGIVETWVKHGLSFPKGSGIHKKVKVVTEVYSPLMKIDLVVNPTIEYEETEREVPEPYESEEDMEEWEQIYQYEDEEAELEENGDF